VRELHPEQHLMRAVSLSVGGLFIPDALPRPIGTVVVLAIELLGAVRSVVVKARVVRVGGGITPGFGVGLVFAAPHPELESYLRDMPNEAEVSTTEWYLPVRDTEH
jgi:Tfp pilus assembly protein PilZ